MIDDQVARNLKGVDDIDFEGWKPTDKSHPIGSMEEHRPRGDARGR